MIRKFFSSRPDHPLADAKALKRVLVELPLDNAFKALDEISGWLESLHHADDFRLDHYWGVVQQLDDAAQVHLRRLTRDYLHSATLSKSDERRLWTLVHGYWGAVAERSVHCLERVRQHPKDKGCELLKPLLPLLAARLIAARAAQLKWVEYRYGPVGEPLWLGLGQAYLAAEAAGYAQKPLQLYPHNPGMTSVSQQYLQALVFSASSMNSLMPLDIELADRLIGHFLPGFVFSADCLADSVYWVDAATSASPVRLARHPEQLTPTLRFFAPGSAPQALNELIHRVERGSVPEHLNLGGQYQPRALLPVLKHLAQYWAPQPPLREHPRYLVKTPIAVLHGFDDCLIQFAGDEAALSKARTLERWMVENVSLGGFSAVVDDLRGDWLKVGSLLSMQPEGGENWVLSAVRRYKKDSETQASVGIQSLSKQAQSVQLSPRMNGVTGSCAIPGIWLRKGGVSGETRMVLPPASFDLRESLEFRHNGQNYLLTPVELEERGADYEIARYREHLAE